MLVTESNNYLKLLQEFPPRPIRSQEDFVAIQAVIDRFLDADEITSDERDYLNLLGILVYEYEEKRVSIPDLSRIELLKALIKEFDLQIAHLIPIFKTEESVSFVLNGHQDLTVEQIEKLSSLLQLSPAVFFKY